MENAELCLLLARHKIPCAEIPLEDGGSVLVLATGARVLRLVGRSGRDFLWLNDALSDERAGKLLSAPGWRNLGGDRTWIAPESDIFISDLRDPWNTYKMPEQFDPGSYSLVQDASSARLTSTFTVRNHRLGVDTELSVEKIVKAAPNPFRHSPDAGYLMSAEYAGYEQLTTLAMISDPISRFRAGLWHLAQVPATGDILVPVTDTGDFRTYFGPHKREGVESSPGLVRFRVDNSHSHKIGIKAASVIGRIGYLRQEDGNTASIIIRNFAVNPSAEYVDVPWDDLEDRGYAVQCYNDDGKLGSFGEVEYHAPGIGDGTGQMSYADRSQLWAFRAARPIIEEIGRRLLAVDLGWK